MKIFILFLLIATELLFAAGEKSNFEGNKAPLFTLKNDQNRFFFLSKELKNPKKDYLFLSFFTNSCKNCPHEREMVQNLKKKYENFDVIYIAIREGDNDTEPVNEFQQKALEIKEKEGLNLVLFDFYSVVSKSYDVKSVPRLIVINTKTQIIEKDITGIPENLEKIYQGVVNKSNK